MATTTDRMYQHYYERGAVFNQQKRYKEALNMLLFSLQLKPNYHLAWLEKGTALEGVGRQEEALAAYSHAVELKPGYAKALFAKCQLLSKLHRTTEALEILHELSRT